ncbi:unnamed protein product [Tetraodon nigroviridis]|uniref:(spotted green pufferfish) hypothetical protein n=1 Tax=Tetraodon nigroviridis TaxID=99883 RepID=Q4RM12_TETNG|nr:unnamed protein product [Tetraodon nigroviridis]
MRAPVCGAIADVGTTKPCLRREDGEAHGVASKIRYLQEYHNRVQHNIYPVPSGTDIANTLKYFSQTLLSVLRDAPSDRGGQGQQSRDAQLSEYPSLDYQGLYVTLVTLLDLVPLLQHGQHVGSTRREGGVPAYINLSASSMLMIAMQYTSNPVYHCQLLECLMKHKQEVWKDLLYVISYGPSQVKPPAVQMLFHYWPNLKPPGAISEYRGLQYTAEISAICQKKNCSSHVRRAVVTCFSAGCCGRHGNRPVRYCKRCHANQHSSEVGAAAETHLYQTSPPPINTRECGAEELVCTVEAVISLLKEAEIHAEQREFELNRRRQMGLSTSHHSLDNIEFDNKEDDQHDQRLLSQFGIWFLVSLCTPNENTPTEILARLVSMVFQWFHSTAYMMDDEVGSLVEKLKPQFVTKWLKTVCEVRFDVMVMCLLPKPAEFARVGGYWDKSCTTVTQLKEGLNRILCLIPYNVISQPLWECFMPEWLEAIRTEVPDHQLKEFREVLSPFKNLGHATGNCALDLDCEDDDMNLGCFILMFDLILKQMELQDDGVMLGLDSSLGKDIVGIINNVFQAPWGGSHTCQKDEKALECSLCQSSILCFQLGCELLERLTPREEIRLVEPTDSLEDTLLASQPDFSLETENGNGECDIPSDLRADSPINQSPLHALEKVAVLCRFLDIGAVTKNHLLKYALAHAFCCFLASVEDVNPAVATRARLLLDTIKRPALQGLCLCLDFQFDTVVRDRPIILSKLLLLHSLKKDVPALSWEFFVNRFETLSLEAQLHLDCNKEFPFPTTITAVRTNVANLSDAAMWKIRRARFARNRQKSVRSLRDSVKGGPPESKRAFSLPESLSNRLPLRLTRQEHSAPTLGDMIEKFLPGQTPSPEDDTVIRDLLPEDAGIDHQTVHQLIMVLMKFMAKDQSSAEADIGSAKAFNTVKRHLYVLLGYDQQEGCFMIAPQKMRTSTCFNAFIAGIAQVMDYNIGLGKQLLPLVVQVLKYCTCPQLRHYFQQPPRCSLWALRPHIRQMWLKALLVILYKYPYRDMDGSKVVLHLIHITINTLNAQYHSCRPHATAGPLYSDNSNMSRYSEKEKEEDSVFDESDVHDTPTGAANKESQTFFARLKRIGGSKSVKYQPVELNARKSEIELSEYREASALQDSILHCVREESTRKKRLQAMHKQKSLDISNTDSILFNLDEHRRKSCIDRCDLQVPPVVLPPSSSRSQSRRRGKGSSDGSSVRVEGSDGTVRRGSRGGQSDISKPVIPEVRLSCMETFEDKLDQGSLAGSAQEKEEQDLIDLSSDCTSIPEKHSLLSMSDSDSLVFEPLPPLRIVESDEEFDLSTIVASKLSESPKVSASSASSNTLRLSPVLQVSVDEGSNGHRNLDLQDGKGTSEPVKKRLNSVTPCGSLELPDRPENVSHESPMTLKQKRDLLRKTPHVPYTSLDDVPVTTEDGRTGVGAGASPSGRTIFLDIPEDKAEPLSSPEKSKNSNSNDEEEEDGDDEEEDDMGDEGDSETKAEDGNENDETEFKIQIVPRQRKQRKIAVSAIQREYLDITFNMFDKLGGEQASEADHKVLSTLEKPRESASAPTLEAVMPETSHRSSVSTQYRQVKRGSLGALTMSQLMKRQLEHQSSAPHNISTWETGQSSQNSPYRSKDRDRGLTCSSAGLTKTSLLSAPSTVSMFVPAPEEFIDEQPTTMSDRCRDCAAVLEEYDEETLSLAVVVLSMFIHLSPDLAAPMLLDIMQSVGRLASSANFSGQAESMLIPGNVAGVAKQFLRCMFHQLAPNGILPQLFQSNIKDGSFLRTLASSLIDFNELSSVAALNMLLEVGPFSAPCGETFRQQGLNNKKSLPAGGPMLHCLENIASFMEALPMDSPSNLWTTICNQFQTFLTKLPSVLPLKCQMDSSLRIIICLLKIPTTNATRSLLDPFSKLLSFVIQYGMFSLSYLIELCGLCYKAFNKERDKFYMSRIVVLELLQALKFKSPLPDTNLLLLVQVNLKKKTPKHSFKLLAANLFILLNTLLKLSGVSQFVCADIGTRLAESTIIQKHMISTLPRAAMECMRQYTSELLDFVADMHTLTKLKVGIWRLLFQKTVPDLFSVLQSHMKACCQPLHEDTFGGNLKVGLAQVAAMEISKGNHRDNKAVVRYLPWLYHPPSAMQQGPKEFIECVSHIRQLSWLLLGSLTHCALHQGSTSCMPIPLDAGSHIADHLIVILIGFPEQSKTSVLHMCSLFHAFMFAQLWTIYCEQAAAAPSLLNQNQTEFSSGAILTGLEFWSRVTPSILQLMAHNKVMVEMVCLHVISLMEALQECNSTIFVKLIPMWLPMIQSNLKHLSAGLQLRLQAIQNRVNHQCLQGQLSAPPFALRKWLQCTQFKMAQVEIQSSEAASQFYPM